MRAVDIAHTPRYAPGTTRDEYFTSDDEREAITRANIVTLWHATHDVVLISHMLDVERGYVQSVLTLGPDPATPSRKRKRKRETRSNDDQPSEQHEERDPTG